MSTSLLPYCGDCRGDHGEASRQSRSFLNCIDLEFAESWLDQLSITPLEARLKRAICAFCRLGSLEPYASQRTHTRLSYLCTVAAPAASVRATRPLPTH